MAPVVMLAACPWPTGDPVLKLPPVCMWLIETDDAIGGWTGSALAAFSNAP